MKTMSLVVGIWVLAISGTALASVEVVGFERAFQYAKSHAMEDYGHEVSVVPPKKGNTANFDGYLVVGVEGSTPWGSSSLDCTLEVYLNPSTLEVVQEKTRERFSCDYVLGN